MQVQMRELEKLVHDANEEHQALQAWGMSLKPYRRYVPSEAFLHGRRHDDEETDP